LHCSALTYFKRIQHYTVDAPNSQWFSGFYIRRLPIGLKTLRAGVKTKPNCNSLTHVFSAFFFSYMCSVLSKVINLVSVEIKDIQLKSSLSQLFFCFSEIFGVQLESWRNIRNWKSFINNLSSPNDGQSYIQTLDLPRSQRLVNIGRRMRTYFLAPESGTYRFYIACDDNCQLNLSTDENLENVVTLVTVKRWTRYKEWKRYGFNYFCLTTNINAFINIFLYTAYKMSALYNGNRVTKTMVSSIMVKTIKR